jgi:hypothetical protein
MAVSQRFKPRYILDTELSDYALPDTSQVTNIMSMIDAASNLIDEHCGRTDGYGNGSLAYSTYMEKLGVVNNIARATFKPLVTIDVTTVNDLQSSGNAAIAAGKRNNFYTGVIPNTTASPLLSCSGRFLPMKNSYRYSSWYSVGDAPYLQNVYQLSAYFGGVPGFQPVDTTLCDVDAQIGQIWLPSGGIYGVPYTEIVLVYNAGYDPRNMPETIKQACAAIVRNMMPFNFTSGMKSMTSGRGAITYSMSDKYIDPNIDERLESFKTFQTG